MFLEAEERSGKYENSVTVVINPRMTGKAKQWIANKCPKLAFEEEKSRETSVDPEQFRIDTTCNESLREFLRPTLQSKEAKRTKGFGKSVKTYAKALGIQMNNDKAKEV